MTQPWKGRCVCSAAYALPHAQWAASSQGRLLCIVADLWYSNPTYGKQNSPHSFTSQHKRRTSWTCAVMLPNSVNSYKITSNHSNASLQRLLSITKLYDLAFCSQTIHRQFSKHAAVGQAVPRPVQSRCCPKKAPLQHLVCCPTPARMHSPLRQICDSHLDERLHSAIQLWCKCGTLLDGVKNDKLGYACNAVTYAKLAQQEIVAFVHCKGCAVVYNA